MLQGREFNVFSTDGYVLFMHRQLQPSSTVIESRANDLLTLIELRIGATYTNEAYFHPHKLALGSDVIVQVLPESLPSSGVLQKMTTVDDSEAAPETVMLFRIIAIERTLNPNLWLMVIAPSKGDWENEEPTYMAAKNYFGQDTPQVQPPKQLVDATPASLVGYGSVTQMGPVAGFVGGGK